MPALDMFADLFSDLSRGGVRLQPTRRGWGMRTRALAILILWLALGAKPALAGGLEVKFDDGKGKPVADVVLLLRPATGQQAPAPKPQARHVIDQRLLMFQPYLQVFRPGDEVVFRNSDSTRHHVYSFSAAGKFEFVLAPAQSSPPLRLAQPGAIAVGCNIHDQMIAYLYVTDAPWVAQSDASGKAVINALPPGDYQLQAWQPRLRPGTPLPAQRVHVDAGSGTVAISVSLRLLPDPRLRAGPGHVHY